jgi:hypothetical protein
MFTKHYHYDFVEFCKQLESVAELSKHLASFKKSIYEIAGRNEKLVYFNFYEILDDENNTEDWDDDIRVVLKFVRPLVNDKDLVLHVWW